MKAKKYRASSFMRALHMIHHPSMPIDLEGMDTDDRVWVMRHRKDCPVNLEGLDSHDRALVIAARPDYQEPATPA